MGMSGIRKMWPSTTSQAIVLAIQLTTICLLVAFLQRRWSGDQTVKNMHVIDGSSMQLNDQPLATLHPKRTAPPTPPPVTSKPTTRKPVEKNPVPDKLMLSNMSDKDMANFYHSYVMSPQTTCSTVRRMGWVSDGGWEMCDDVRFKPDSRNCLVYSFGIKFDFSYDDDMEEYGCEVHSFDPSMKNTKDHLRGRRIHFHATGISGHDDFITGGPRVQKWKLYTLKTHRMMLNHSSQQRRIDIVKMDIEGSELDTLTEAVRDGSLKDVRQLSWETHLSLSRKLGRNGYIKFITLLRALYEAGFRIYHTSRNITGCVFYSVLIGKQRVFCHEINMVNINIINNKSNNNKEAAITTRTTGISEPASTSRGDNQ